LLGAAGCAATPGVLPPLRLPLLLPAYSLSLYLSVSPLSLFISLPLSFPTFTFNPCVAADPETSWTLTHRVATRRVGANARDGIRCNNAHAEFRKRT